MANDLDEKNSDFDLSHYLGMVRRRHLQVMRQVEV